jgi:hypothetical protein
MTVFILLLLKLPWNLKDGHIQLDLFTVLQHFVVVEFTHKSGVDNILNVSSYINKAEVIPVWSPFLWFRASKKDLQPKYSSPQPPSLVETNGNSTPTPVELRSLMQGAESVSLTWTAVTSVNMGDNNHVLFKCDTQEGVNLILLTALLLNPTQPCILTRSVWDTCLNPLHATSWLDWLSYLHCIFFLFILSGMRLSLLILRPLLAYCTSPRW